MADHKSGDLRQWDVHQQRGKGSRITNARQGTRSSDGNFRVEVVKPQENTLLTEKICIFGPFFSEIMRKRAIEFSNFDFLWHIYKLFLN